ncbi:MAG: GNAT family N-acetyltransferase [Deltaproteobacteria bacterium]|nr:GNAT family N-acetyltransferase [Deltaproteobacteria bacterium]
MREVERAAEEIFPLDVLPQALRGASLTSDDEFEAARRDGLLWCALDARDRVIGYAIALWLGDRSLHLDEIDVHPAEQRRGVGRALIQSVRAHAEANGAPRLTLTTFRGVAWNMPWYERIGFVELTPSELAGELSEIFEAEVTRGLARERRVAMALDLAR